MHKLFHKKDISNFVTLHLKTFIHFFWHNVYNVYNVLSNYKETADLIVTLVLDCKAAIFSKTNENRRIFSLKEKKKRGRSLGFNKHVSIISLDINTRYSVHVLDQSNSYVSTYNLTLQNPLEPLPRSWLWRCISIRQSTCCNSVNCFVLFRMSLHSHRLPACLPACSSSGLFFYYIIIIHLQRRTTTHLLLCTKFILT